MKNTDLAPRPQTKKVGGPRQATLWRKFKEALEYISEMPSAALIANAVVPREKRGTITTRLPIVMDWLDDFKVEWSKSRAGDGGNESDPIAAELRAVTRAWDRISDDARKAFVAELKTRGSL